MYKVLAKILILLIGAVKARRQPMRGWILSKHYLTETKVSNWKASNYIIFIVIFLKKMVETKKSR